MTIQKTGLILNLSHHGLSSWQQCQDIMSLIEDVTNIHLDQLCDENGCDRHKYTINFNQGVTGQDVSTSFLYWKNQFPESCVLEINQSIGSFLRDVVPALKLRTRVPTGRLNFSVSQCGPSFFMLNYVYFEA